MSLASKVSVNGSGAGGSAAAALAGAAAAKSPSGSLGGGDENWQVPTFPMDFDLEEAKKVAYEKAKDYMNKILHLEDMAVFMEEEEENAGLVGKVKDLKNGNVVNEYAATDLLKLYAANESGRGIIADGVI